MQKPLVTIQIHLVQYNIHFVVFLLLSLSGGHSRKRTEKGTNEECPSTFLEPEGKSIKEIKFLHFNIRTLSYSKLFTVLDLKTSHLVGLFL